MTPGRATVSLIVATRNRAAKLRALLEAVRVIEDDLWELVIVDNGSTDDTPEVIREFRESSPPVPVRTANVPRPGLGRARNSGVAISRGEILAFTDDDCYPSPSLVAAIREAFARPDVGYVGGRVLLHDPEDLPVTVTTSTTAFDVPPHQFLPTGTIHGANMAVRRSALSQVGGFNPLLGAGTRFPAEDIELLCRLSWAGWEGRFEPRAVVYHHHGRQGAAALRALHCAYDRGRGAYYVAMLAEGVGFRLVARAWLRSGWSRSALPSRWRELTSAGRYLLSWLLARQG